MSLNTSFGVCHTDKVEASELVAGTVEAAGDPAGVPSSGPDATARAFARALLARDPRAAAIHLAPDAHLITPDGTEVIGREPIQRILEQLSSAGRTLEIRAGRTIVSSEGVALCTQHWRWGDADPQGRLTAAHLVLARDVRWKIVIACPWG
jgi:ketosteroid isomerase-like protein